MLYFFTYGSEGQPFVGGWTEVEALDRHAAVEAFRSFHPDKIAGLVNCSDIYDEKAFRRTEMARSGNFGKFCHEKIKIERTLLK